uniref:GSG1 protein n=1 Tax=Anopheles darlingi TaxID=43151 RepID=B6DE26_ANODA
MLNFGFLSLLLITLHVVVSSNEQLNLEPSRYCAVPENGTVAPEFKDTCRQETNTDRQRLVKEIDNIHQKLNTLMATTIPLDSAFQAVINKASNLETSLESTLKQIKKMRQSVMIAAIGAGRIAEAIAQYLKSGSWQDKATIIERIYSHPSKSRRHIVNLLQFIRALPIRTERVEFYYLLKDALIKKNEHEGYLGALFVYDVHQVAFEHDGETVLDAKAERELWSVMLNATVAYFKRAFLVGNNREELIALDRYHFSVFNMLFFKITKITTEDLRKFDAARMIELPCLMYDSYSKILFYRKTIQVLTKHFKWADHNHLVAPKLAGLFNSCMSEIRKDDKHDAVLLQQTKQLFMTFKDGENFESLLKKNVDK